MTRRTAQRMGVLKTEQTPAHTLTLCSITVHASTRGTIPSDELRTVQVAALAGKLPSTAEVEAFSALTSSTIPSPRWDAAPIITPEAA